jgi:4-hydroxy-3-methylbut-2-enyl diphosphate reductase
MSLKIERATSTGFCFGVERAVAMLEEATRSRGGLETLGAVVHNRQVLRRLESLGVCVVGSVAEVEGDTVAISSHGVGPLVIKEIRQRGINIIDTTCPFVKRAQVAARRLTEAGFYTVIYGDASHPEVKGILGWAGGKGKATLANAFLREGDELPRHLGVLSQTTQIPANFAHFVRNVIDVALVKDSELRIIDTLCHDIRKRQESALKLAGEVDLVLVVGGHNSANTRHLVELCSQITDTCLVETATEIEPSWLEGRRRVGITTGASTDEQAIDEVLARLKAIA